MNKNNRTLEKRKNAAELSGYEFLGNVVDEPDIPKRRWCDHGLYKRLSCGHSRVLLHTNIENGIIDCKQCIHEEYIKLVESLGMKFVGFNRPRKNATLYVDVVLSCGHTKSIQTGNLRNGTYHCKTCWFESLNSITQSHGITMVSSLGATKWECILPCGCRSNLLISNAQRGSWSCEHHKTSYVYWKSKIYLVRIETASNKWLKLGVSSDTVSRCNEYGIKGDYSFNILKEIDFDTGSEAVKLEKKLHSKYRKSKLCPTTMKSIMNYSGYTECYPLEMESILMSELTKLKETNE